MLADFLLFITIIIIIIIIIADFTIFCIKGFIFQCFNYRSF